jgi:hypothetical protein
MMYPEKGSHIMVIRKRYISTQNGTKKVSPMIKVVTGEIGVNTSLGRNRITLRTVFALMLHSNPLLNQLYH